MKTGGLKGCVLLFENREKVQPCVFGVFLEGLKMGRKWSSCTFWPFLESKTQPRNVDLTRFVACGCVLYPNLALLYRKLNFYINNRN